MQYHQSNPNSIQSLFDAIAPRYDLGNWILSLGLFKLCNLSLIRRVLQTTHPSTMLDLCCGTGEITLSYLTSRLGRRVPPREAYLVDFSKNMLEKGNRRAKRHTLATELHWVQGDAHEIPLPDNSIDTAVIAYGIRNVERPRDCLEEIRRVLVPGGFLGILELTRPRHKFLRTLHHYYMRAVAPLVGKLLSRNPEAYSYLHHSIQEFASPAKLLNITKSAGFSAHAEPLLGGVAHLVIGKAD